MKDWIWLTLAFMTIYIGGLAVIVWLFHIYMNGGF